jgi:O-succinylbenzoate synthase
LAGAPERILPAASRLRKTACQAVKLKVGRAPSVDDDARLVREVRRRLRPDQALRLDANRAWDFDTAVEFGRAVAPCDIAYIEEPLRQPRRLEQFRQSTGCDYALDETLLESPDLRAYPGVAALIIKPTLLGGSDDIQPLAATGIPLVFSACFESGVGIYQIGQLALRWAPGRAAGVDTYSRLARDVLWRPLRMRNWMLTLDSRPQVNLEQLREIA